MVRSQLSPNINYSETADVGINDDGLERDVVVIDNILNNSIDGIIGNVNREHEKDEEVIYFNIYGVDGNDVKRIGVIEHPSHDYGELVDDNDNISYGRLNEPLLFSYVNENFLKRFRYSDEDTTDDEDTDSELESDDENEMDEDANNNEEIEDEETEDDETDSEEDEDEEQETETDEDEESEGEEPKSEDQETETENEKEEVYGDILEEEVEPNSTKKENTIGDDKKTEYNDILERHTELKQMRQYVEPGTPQYREYVSKLNILKKDIDSFKAKYA